MEITNNYSTILATIDKISTYGDIEREFKFLDPIEVNKAFEGTALNKTYQAVNGDFINVCTARIASVLGTGVAQGFKVVAGGAAGGVVGVVLNYEKKGFIRATVGSFAGSTIGAGAEFTVGVAGTALIGTSLLPAVLGVLVGALVSYCVTRQVDKWFLYDENVKKMLEMCSAPNDHDIDSIKKQAELINNRLKADTDKYFDELKGKDQGNTLAEIPIIGTLMVIVAGLFGQGTKQIDPLVLDLDGDGIETISLTNSTVHFDLDQNTIPEKTAWLSSDDGFLVIDKNNNGNLLTEQSTFVYNDDTTGVINNVVKVEFTNFYTFEIAA